MDEDCCFHGCKWDGTPAGTETKLAENNVYVTGSSKDRAILLIHDAFGWKFPNTRLLADYYASEVGATVYMPDFYGGEVLDWDILLDKSKQAQLGPIFKGVSERNAKSIREPEIFACARALRAEYKRVGAIGFCYGGWAVFRLGAKGNNLVDCISTGHPSWLVKSEVESVGVPTQILAPETDHAFNPDLKRFANETIPALGLPYDYQFFPGLEHAFCTRGDPENKGEKEGVERAKRAAVYWFKLFL